MAYVDGFVIPLPKENLEAYKKMSLACGAVWKEFGALEFREAIGDDVPPGKVTSFPMSVDLKENETVVFSWIVYKSRRDRDRINKLVMADPRLSAENGGMENMPCDAKRMIFGGFKTMIEL